MLGVIKIDEKKVLKPINEILADPWQVDIQELFEASVNEPDEIKLIFCKKDKKILLIVHVSSSSPLKAHWGVLILVLV